MKTLPGVGVGVEDNIVVVVAGGGLTLVITMITLLIGPAPQQKLLAVTVNSIRCVSSQFSYSV